jgi:transposase
MKRQTETKGKRRTHYSDEFKREALVRAERDGVSVAARELSLHESQLYAWRSKDRQRSLGSEETRLLHAELARLKRENARLEEEAAFLKKAAAYFAKDAKRGTP